MHTASGGIGSGSAGGLEDLNGSLQTDPAVGGGFFGASRSGWPLQAVCGHWVFVICWRQATRCSRPS